jgi:hypothetical protein
MSRHAAYLGALPLVVGQALFGQVMVIGPGAFGANAVRLNFDDLSPGTVLGDLYQSKGVVFSNAVVIDSPFAPSPPNDIVSTSSAPLEILFPGGVKRVGVQIDSDGYNLDRQPQIRVFDKSGNLLGTQAFGQGPDFEGFEATQGLIYRVLLGTCSAYRDTTCASLLFSDGYDNLIFETAGCQVNVTRQLSGAQRSLTHMPTEMNAEFTTDSGIPLSEAAIACDPNFVGFSWQQTFRALPCPSPFRASPPDVGQQNVCSDGSLTAPPFFADPPLGGYMFPVKYLGYNPFPFYYPSATVLDQEQIPTNLCINDHVPCTPLVTPDGAGLAFYDAPSDPCLPGARPDLNLVWCSGTTAPQGSVMRFTTALVGINQDGTASSPLSQWTWTDTFNGTSGGIPTTYNNLAVDSGSGTGGITITNINGVPQTPPSVSCAATPSTLWPPNGKSVLVTVSGMISPGTSPVASGNTAYAVTDEYGQVQPTGSITVDVGGNYAFEIPLIAARDGNDLNGRTFTILVTATDNIGNVGSCSTTVTVPHDQSQ